MKQQPAILFIAMLMLCFACKKSATTTNTQPKSTTAYASTGTIYGVEPFMTNCDAKYWIKIDDPSAGRTFDSLPAGSGIDPDFPTMSDSIKVKLNWHNTGVCSRVVIDAIERAD